MICVITSAECKMLSFRRGQDGGGSVVSLTLLFKIFSLLSLYYLSELKRLAKPACQIFFSRFLSIVFLKLTLLSDKSPFMGAKKRRRSTPEQAGRKKGKQMKLNYYLSENGKNLETITIPASSEQQSPRFENGRGEREEEEEKQMDSTGKQMDSARKITSREEFSEMEPQRTPRKASNLELLSKQTSLITETVISLYTKIDQIILKLNELNEAFNMLSETVQEPPRERDNKRFCQGDISKGPRSGPNLREAKNITKSYSLQNKQLAFLIGNISENYK